MRGRTINAIMPAVGVIGAVLAMIVARAIS